MLSDSLQSFIQDLDDVRSGKKLERIISTSLPFLDKKMFGGFESGQLIILAARPGVGKSALGVQFAKSAALQGKRTLFFSLEMPQNELLSRLVASEGIDYGQIRQALTGQSGDITELYTQIQQSEQVLAPLPLSIVDRAGLAVETIKEIAREEQAEFIVVDYLQLCRTRAKTDNREQQVAEISRQLKELAKELSCPVVSLAQLNRNLVHRVNKRPRMEDLRESGGIEQDADVIMFIYREACHAQNVDPEKVELIISKQRAGEPFSYELRFIGKHMKFEEGMSW